LDSLFWVQFSFERRRIVDTLTDFKRKVNPKEAVKSGNLLWNHSIAALRIYFLMENSGKR
jgi:hypothetical protein